MEALLAACQRRKSGPDRCPPRRRRGTETTEQIPYRWVTTGPTNIPLPHDETASCRPAVPSGSPSPRSRASWGDVGANIARHLDLIARARTEGAEVLLFPEMSLTGHSAGADCPDGGGSIATTPRSMRSPDAAGPMVTAFGLIEDIGRRPVPQTPTMVVRDGGVAFIHRKINLATYGKLDDHRHFAAGRFVETFPIRRCLARQRADLQRTSWNPALVHLAATHTARRSCWAPISSALEAVGAEFDNTRRLGPVRPVLLDGLRSADPDIEPGRRRGRAIVLGADPACSTRSECRSSGSPRRRIWSSLTWTTSGSAGPASPCRR